MKEFMEQIECAQTIGITGHIHPDGDCIGSCLALRQYISEKYPEKQTDVYLEPISDEFLFLSGAGQILTIPKNEKYDLFLYWTAAVRTGLNLFPAWSAMRILSSALIIISAIRNGKLLYRRSESKRNLRSSV